MKTFIVLKNEQTTPLPSHLSGDVRFPEGLVKHFLMEFTQSGDTVFDPFAGFGTTLYAAEQMGRIPYGIECDAARVAYARSLLARPENRSHLIQGDTRELVSFNLPPFDFSFTSPPYLNKHDPNPLRSDSSEGDGYGQYLSDLQAIYAQIGRLLRPGARAVIEVANLKGYDGLTTLAWDIAAEISHILHFEGEVVVGWEETYGYGYDHSYCLIFSKE